MAASSSSTSIDTLIQRLRFEELDEHSPRAEQPACVTVPLKAHQLTLLQQCINMETTDLPLQSSTDRHEVNNCMMRTRIGIIGDKVGSGKSYVIIALIASPCNTMEPRTRMSTFALDNIIIKHNDDSTFSNTSVLVIPHNLVKQWITYFEAIAPSLRACFITTTKQLNAFIEGDQTFDVIIVSSTFYMLFSNISRNKQMTFSRLIFDEVDNIQLKSCEPVKSKFTWFVTASFKNLMHPRGHGIWDPRTHRFVNIAEGVKSTGYIRTLFTHMAPALTQLIVTKNKDEYVDASMQLPPLSPFFVRCLTPRTIRILDGIVDRSIMAALNANDVESAIQHIAPSHRSTEENIIKLLLEKYTRLLQNSRTMLRMVNEEFVYDNPTTKENELQRHQKVIEEYESKIANIEERIMSTNTCCICFDGICNKTIVDCCKNAFCFKCINMWLSTQMHTSSRNSCPSCRKPINTENMYVVSATNVGCSAGAGASTSNAVNANSIGGAPVSEMFDKMKNLEVIIDHVLGSQTPGKILIFSCFDNIFEQSKDFLERANRRFALLKGSHDVIASIVNQYKNGSLNILLVNPRNYGSGLNLENTTDIIMMHKFDNEIEHQVIGRAQRYGRKDPLKVWYLLHDNEM